MSATLSYAHAAGASVSESKDEQRARLSASQSPAAANSSAEPDLDHHEAVSPHRASGSPEKARTPSISGPTSTSTVASEPTEGAESPEPAAAAAPQASQQSPAKTDWASSAKELRKSKLAPAPLPSTNAWGTMPRGIPAGKNPITETIMSKTRSHSGEGTNPASVFKAPAGKEKWVPYKASVVIASGAGKAVGAGSAASPQKQSFGKKKGSKKKVKEERRPVRKEEEAVKPAVKDAPKGLVNPSDLLADGETKTVSASSTPSATTSTATTTPTPPVSSSSTPPASTTSANYGLHQQPQPQQNHYQNGNKGYSNGRSYSKNGSGQNGGYQRQYRPHNNQNNVNRRYSNGGYPYVSYNRPYYMPMMYVPPKSAGADGKAANGDAAEPDTAADTAGRRHSANSHHGSAHRNSYDSPYVMQPFYPQLGQMGYVPYGQPYGMMLGPQVQYNNNSSPSGEPPSARDVQLDGLARQIDYYFSPANLIKDIFLRKNMNDAGFLPLGVVAGFYRVSAMSYNDLQAVIDSLPRCKNLEYGTVEAADGKKTYKVRPAGGSFQQWILPEAQRTAAGKDATVPTALGEQKAAPAPATDDKKGN